MTSQTDLQTFLPLSSAVLHILLALAEGERHGYAIMQQATTLSSGKLQLGPGTLYRSIKRLLADGLIEETEKRSDPALDDQRRRYYRLTSLGEQVLTLEIERLSHLVQVAKKRGFDGNPA
ncbi:MAG: PadR family transcriptional regulator [Chloroflexota bacterium]